MWKRAKKDLGKYPEVVVNAKDAEGRGVSVRQRTVVFDEATGTLPVSLPSTLGVVPGPATVLGHFHDEKVWNMHSMSIKGALEQRAGQWVFVASSYRPARIMDFLRGTRGWERSADGGAPSPGAAVDAEAAVVAAAVLVGSFAGFGSAEAGGWPWIEFAYTPETEVHCEPTGALQA